VAPWILNCLTAIKYAESIRLEPNLSFFLFSCRLNSHFAIHYAILQCYHWYIYRRKSYDLYLGYMGILTFSHQNTF